MSRRDAHDTRQGGHAWLCNAHPDQPHATHCKQSTASCHSRSAIPLTHSIKPFTQCNSPSHKPTPLPMVCVCHMVCLDPHHLRRTTLEGPCGPPAPPSDLDVRRRFPPGTTSVEDAPASKVGPGAPSACWSLPATGAGALAALPCTQWAGSVIALWVVHTSAHKCALAAYTHTRKPRLLIVQTQCLLFQPNAFCFNPVPFVSTQCLLFQPSASTQCLLFQPSASHNFSQHHIIMLTLISTRLSTMHADALLFALFQHRLNTTP